MDIKTYQQGALQTEKPFPLPKRLRHAIIGCFTEVGEFASQVKRVAIYGKDADTARKEGEPTPRQGMFEELHDSCWYIGIGFDAAGEDMRMIMAPIAFQEEDTLTDRLAKLTFMMGSVTGALAGLALRSDEHLVNGRADLAILFGQLLYLINMTAELLGFTLEQLFIANNEKLLSGKTARYGASGYSDQAAEARADKDGAAHTES
ncbi:hypothetical protein PJWF_00041 [Achromobacter phage JWF]|uniref:MazG-like pyrophosphatase n=1 Tax=Achromobacter phage JWF TaxID=1589748 RepID=UPI000588E410|nr:MazG-like pyrophosphatase [Achromobacter phage JWF]AJD82935.1 hypothetical protein PJWF_00041 [Achromobacter phage JWF]